MRNNLGQRSRLGPMDLIFGSDGGDMSRLTFGQEES